MLFHVALQQYALVNLLEKCRRAGDTVLEDGEVEIRECGVYIAQHNVFTLVQMYCMLYVNVGLCKVQNQPAQLKHKV